MGRKDNIYVKDMVREIYDFKNEYRIYSNTGKNFQIPWLENETFRRRFFSHVVGSWNLQHGILRLNFPIGTLFTSKAKFSRLTKAG